MTKAEELAALESAMNRGVREVQYGDRREVFRSLVEMEQLRRRLRIQLGLTDGATQAQTLEWSKGITPAPFSGSSPATDWQEIL